MGIVSSWLADSRRVNFLAGKMYRTEYECSHFIFMYCESYVVYSTLWFIFVTHNSELEFL